MEKEKTLNITKKIGMTTHEISLYKNKEGLISGDYIAYGEWFVLETTKTELKKTLKEYNIPGEILEYCVNENNWEEVKYYEGI